MQMLQQGRMTAAGSYVLCTTLLCLAAAGYGLTVAPKLKLQSTFKSHR